MRWDPYNRMLAWQYHVWMFKKKCRKFRIEKGMNMLYYEVSARLEQKSDIFQRLILTNFVKCSDLFFLRSARNKWPVNPSTLDSQTLRKPAKQIVAIPIWGSSCHSCVQYSSDDPRKWWNWGQLTWDWTFTSDTDLSTLRKPLKAVYLG